MQNEPSAFVELSTSSTTNRYTEEERNYHCEGWQKSGLSMNEYCKRSGIAISSLSKWLNENKRPTLTTNEKLETPLANASHQALEIILTSGLRLRFSRLPVAELLRLIRALESCN